MFFSCSDVAGGNTLPLIMKSVLNCRYSGSEYSQKGYFVTEINGLKTSKEARTYWAFLLRNAKGVEGDCMIQYGEHAYVMARQ